MVGVGGSRRCRRCRTARLCKPGRTAGRATTEDNMAGASTDDMQVELTEELTHRQRTRLEQVESLPWVEKCAAER